MIRKIGIIGGGIAGSCLVKSLFENKIEFHWFSDKKNSASHISSGIINPITGRRYALSWRYEELLSIAKIFYGESLVPIKLAKHFTPYNEESTIYDTIKSNEKFLTSMNDQWIEVRESYQLQTKKFIAAMLDHAENLGNLSAEPFIYKDLTEDNSCWKYNEHYFSHIIFAEGIFVKNNPFFCHLPFQPNRGEAILIDILSDKPTTVKKYGKFICPFENNYWIGSSFDKVDMSAPAITEKVKNELISSIPNFIQHTNYNLIDHLGAFRSTTPDRRPIIGEHPFHKGLFIFNGFGTKGASLAPWCSYQIINYILKEARIESAISISRFK